MIELFDSHSHYNDEKFTENLQELIQKTYEAGITKWICAGYSVESSKKSSRNSKTKQANICNMWNIAKRCTTRRETGSKKYRRRNKKTNIRNRATIKTR